MATNGLVAMSAHAPAGMSFTQIMETDGHKSLSLASAQT